MLVNWWNLSLLSKIMLTMCSIFVWGHIIGLYNRAGGHAGLHVGSRACHWWMLAASCSCLPAHQHHLQSATCPAEQPGRPDGLSHMSLFYYFKYYFYQVFKHATLGLKAASQTDAVNCQSKLPGTSRSWRFLFTSGNKMDWKIFLRLYFLQVMETSQSAVARHDGTE